jgi:hypothetical protein
MWKERFERFVEMGGLEWETYSDVGGVTTDLEVRGDTRGQIR